MSFPASSAYSKTLTGILAGLATGALWGLVFAAPMLTTDTPGLAISLGRYAVYALFCVFILLGKRKTSLWPLFRQHYKTAILFGLLGNSLYYSLVVWSVKWSNPAIPSLLVGTAPIWLALTDAFRHKGHGLLSTLAMPLLAIITGLVLINLEGLHAGHAGSAMTFLIGVLFAVGAVTSWSTYAILNTRFLKKHPDISGADWSTLIGLGTGISLLFFLPLFDRQTIQHLLHPDTRLLIIWITLGIGSTWVATWLWNIASQNLTLGLAGQLIISETLFALLYAALLSQTWPAQMALLAIACFVFGVLRAMQVFMSIKVA
ncbi:DMT family transporter [Leeia oryzae]|uniref:DMT family transporter n=1 Tax=Leeia oryzae TaxID=356662 RepID=UPI000366249A|nr:DMT family transporter [Leeia oryzae]